MHQSNFCQVLPRSNCGRWRYRPRPFCDRRIGFGAGGQYPRGEQTRRRRAVYHSFAVKAQPHKAVNTESQNPSVVLIVDDESQMRRLLRASLERNGYFVVEAANGAAGLEQVTQRQPNLILLDLGLPDLDGIEVLKRLRSWTQAPVLVISVRYHEDEKINALDNGADDYVTKPFGTRELLARLRVAERHRKISTTSSFFQTGSLSVDFDTRTVKRGEGKIKLTATEFSILRLFIQHAGKVLTHGQILRAIWGTEDMEKTGYLRVYMAYLRDKLETDPSEPELLVTEPGVGYRLVILDPMAH